MSRDSYHDDTVRVLYKYKMFLNLSLIQQCHSTINSTRGVFYLAAYSSLRSSSSQSSLIDTIQKSYL